MGSILQRQSRQEIDKRPTYQKSQSLTPYHTRYESHTSDISELNRQRFRQIRILSTVDYYKHGIEKPVEKICNQSENFLQKVSQ